MECFQNNTQHVKERTNFGSHVSMKNTLQFDPYSLAYSSYYTYFIKWRVMKRYGLYHAQLNVFYLFFTKRKCIDVLRRKNWAISIKQRFPNLYGLPHLSFTRKNIIQCFPKKEKTFLSKQCKTAFPLYPRATTICTLHHNLNQGMRGNMIFLSKYC